MRKFVFITGTGRCGSKVIHGLLDGNPNLNIIPISKYGIDSSIKEALLMAFLGACRKLNLNGNMRSVTGANAYCVLGDFYDG